MNISPIFNRLALVAATFLVVAGSSGCKSDRGTTGAALGTEPPKPWTQLFNGRDLAGWKTHVWEDAPTWVVKDGVLRSTGGKGYLRTEESFRDFELTLEARVSDSAGGRGNSGIYIRSQPHLDQKAEYPPAYEVQIDHGDGGNPTGSLYNRHKARAVGLKDGEWFRMRIQAVGPHIQVWVNDQPVLDVQDNTFADGYTFLQQHHKTGVCEFRNIRIRRL